MSACTCAEDFLLTRDLLGRDQGSSGSSLFRLESAALHAWASASGLLGGGEIAAAFSAAACLRRLFLGPKLLGSHFIFGGFLCGERILRRFFSASKLGLVRRLRSRRRGLLLGDCVLPRFLRRHGDAK